MEEDVRRESDGVFVLKADNSTFWQRLYYYLSACQARVIQTLPNRRNLRAF